MNHKRAVFLDRDDTLVKSYEGRPANTADEIALLPGVAEGLRRLKGAGYILVVVTNQGGIGMGYITAQILALQHERLNDLLLMAGAPPIDAFYWCPHSPGSGCVCRKPSPEMIRRAASNLSIDLGRSFMVGDDIIDMRAGEAAGLRKKLMVVSDRYRENTAADLIFSSFDQAAEAIVVMGAT